MRRLHLPLPTPALPALLVTLSAAGLATLGAAGLSAPAARAAEAQAPRIALPTLTATARPQAAQAGYEGVVEAVRQTVVAAQVPGEVLELPVKLGDRVQAGQLLVRLDARAADQGVAASEAQVQAARAKLELATREVERQRTLHARQYISQAALERGESEFRAAQAQANAQLAQAGAARTQTSFHLIRAPFAGVITELPVQRGDMAMPGKPLLTLVDPTALRVSAAVPLSVAAQLGAQAAAGARVELPALPAGRQWLIPIRLQRLPTADAGTHTVVLRADLPPTAPGSDAAAPMPGQFARLWLPAGASATPAALAGTAANAPPTAAGLPAPATAAARGSAALRVPLSAVVRRAELSALYVLDANGRPLLRQVRLGLVQGEQVEVLAGLNPGEVVVTDPQAAARAR